MIKLLLGLVALVYVIESIYMALNFDLSTNGHRTRFSDDGGLAAWNTGLAALAVTQVFQLVAVSDQDLEGHQAQSRHRLPYWQR
ncbi:hypothetical protein VTN49DRAFT_3273 [Thermomyces lanuginosus]|uniref:uncharacterized protein n=1 Tax=Thermomyces lanuginosus TaxID=5541 RepID=UPI003743C896